MLAGTYDFASGFRRDRLSGVAFTFGRHTITWTDLFFMALAAAGSLVAATFSLELWHAHLHAPLTYAGDELAGMQVAQMAISGPGWILTNHQVGYPFGLELYDFPFTTDALNFFSETLLGLIWDSPAKVINVFYLLTFPAEAAVGYVMFRWLGISKWTALVLAILFADAPYHLFRGEANLTLSEYLAIPFGSYFLLSVLDGRRFIHGHIRQPRSWMRRRNLFVGVLCVVIGAIGLYYAVFTIVLMIPTGIAAAIKGRSWLPAVQAAVVVVLIALTLGVELAPSAVYESRHGQDTAVAHRDPAESEIYGLKLAAMMLPAPGDRIPGLASLRNTYETTTPLTGEDPEQTLGLVGDIGLVWIIVVAFGGVAGLAGRRWWQRRQMQLGFLALVAFVVGTVGGVSALIAYTVSPEIRAWNRISIFIAFFALAGLGLGFDAIGRRWLGRRWRGRWPLLAGAALAAVLVGGVFDQSPTQAVPLYAYWYHQYSSDSAFVAQIQKIMPKGSAIFQMPYMPFPEYPGINNEPDYDPIRGSANSTTLKWSYPVMQGRPADWDSQTTTVPTQTLVDGLIAAGLTGIWIDHAGYVDGGAQLSSQLQALLNEPPMTSQDGSFTFFDLRNYAAKLRQTTPSVELDGLRTAMLYPLEITWGTGFYAPDSNNGRWSLSSAPVTIVNNLGRPRTGEFFANVQTNAHGRYTLTASVGSQVVGHFTITNQSRPIEFKFPVALGTETLTLSSNAPAQVALGDPRDLAVYYQDATVYGSSIAPFLPGGPHADAR